MPPFSWPFVVLGLVGGLIPDAVRLIKNRHETDVPAYLRRFNFWLGLFLLILMGGAAAWLLGAATSKEALAYGYSAPELVSKVLAKTGEQGAVDRGAGELDVRTWWAL
jgi:hypothetical protein